MLGIGGEAEAIATKLFSGSLEDNRIEEAVRKCKVEKGNAAKLMSLVQLMASESCERFETLYGVLLLCVKFLNAGLIDQSFAYALMVRKG